MVIHVLEWMKQAIKNDWLLGKTNAGKFNNK